MRKIQIREDFRRDGLAMNFLTDESMMLQFAKAFPESKINIGYPSICSKEEETCRKIAEALKSEPVEVAVVGHALKSHLDVMADIVNRYSNTSANFWVPASDYMIGNTFRKPAEKVLEYSKDMVKYWRSISDRPLDVALVDSMASECQMRKRIQKFYEGLKQSGVRSVIICDTKGATNPQQLRDILLGFKEKNPDIEYHPHNDNKRAKINIEMAISRGIKIIGTAVYGFGERATMVDPRELRLKYDIPYRPEEFEKFDCMYQQMISRLTEKEKIFTKQTVVTGTQYRLRGRNNGSLITKFGVTSDKFILSKLSGIKIEAIGSDFLSWIKDCLYTERKRVYSPEELRSKHRQFLDEKLR